MASAWRSAADRRYSTSLRSQREMSGEYRCADRDDQRAWRFVHLMLTPATPEVVVNVGSGLLHCRQVLNTGLRPGHRVWGAHKPTLQTGQPPRGSSR